jgi:hypothetical protein
MKMDFSGIFRRVVWYIIDDFSEELNVNIITLMMEALNTYETSVTLYQIKWRKIPEDSSFVPLIYDFTLLHVRESISPQVGNKIKEACFKT